MVVTELHMNYTKLFAILRMECERVCVCVCVWGMCMMIPLHMKMNGECCGIDDMEDEMKGLRTAKQERQRCNRKRRRDGERERALTDSCRPKRPNNKSNERSECKF